MSSSAHKSSDFKLYKNSGFACFDDPVKTEEGGWLACAGKPAERFETAAQIQPPTLWITNIDWNEFSKSGFAGAGHIRRPDWLKTSPRAICAEIGFPQNTIGNKRSAELLSEIYDRVNELAWSFFPDMKPQATLARTVLQLAGDLPADESVLSERRLLESATQDRSVVPQDAWEPELITVRFVPNRVNYFSELLSMPVPTGKVERLKKKMSVESFILGAEPLIAQIELKGTPENLCAFGHQGMGAPIPRRCVTQSEALMLIESIDIEIEKIWRIGDIAPPPLLPHIPPIETIPFISDSYSLGLLFEAMAYGLMEKTYDRRLSKNDAYYLRARACYLKSVDRTLCYGLAKNLKSLGISRIFSYGMGQVSARIVKDYLDEAQAIGAECGFMLMAYEI